MISPARWGAGDAYEVPDRNAKNLGNLIQATGRDPINTPLVFMGLLVGNADQVGNLLLAISNRYPALSDLGTNVPVSICGAVCLRWGIGHCYQR